MSRLTKALFQLLIALLLASTLITVQSAFAQSTVKPSVPEFTVESVGPSFDIPPTYPFNSTTGLFDTNNGYHIEFSAVKIIIKNQPFTNQTNLDYLYYNVRIKPHNYPNSYWLELFSAGNDGFPTQTLSNYTTIPCSVEGAQVLGNTIPIGATTDIQVEAMIGHIGRNQTMIPYPYPYVFFGETSGWSNTQSVTLPPKTPLLLSPSLTPNFTLQPTSKNSITLPLTFFVIVISIFVLIITTLCVLLYRKYRKIQEP